jgi:hypothetical protein
MMGPIPPPIGELDRRNNRWVALSGIVGGVLVAIIGIGSSLITAHLQAHSSAAQSHDDFVRQQRQSAYISYLSKVEVAESDANILCGAPYGSGPIDVTQSSKDMNNYNGDEAEVYSAWVLVQIVGSDATLKKGKVLWNAAQTVYQDAIEISNRIILGKYSIHQRSVDYKKCFGDTEKIEAAKSDLLQAARDDLQKS